MGRGGTMIGYLGILAGGMMQKPNKFEKKTVVGMDEPTDGPTDQVQRIPLYFYCVYCFSSINSVRITPRSHLGASSNSKLSWLMSYSSSARGPKCRIVCRFMRPSDNLLAITNVALYVDLRVCQSICMAVVWSHVISLAFWVNCFFFKNDFGFHGYDQCFCHPPRQKRKYELY